jgi:hypothetical protein
MYLHHGKAWDVNGAVSMRCTSHTLKHDMWRH